MKNRTKNAAAAGSHSSFNPTLRWRKDQMASRTVVGDRHKYFIITANTDYLASLEFSNKPADSQAIT